MGQHNKPKYQNMRLEEELQARMNDIAKISEGLVDNKMGGWMALELPEGNTVIAFVLTAGKWTFENGKIILGHE